jgi:hypothetical protein
MTKDAIRGGELAGCVRAHGATLVKDIALARAS